MKKSISRATTVARMVSRMSICIAALLLTGYTTEQLHISVHVKLPLSFKCVSCFAGLCVPCNCCAIHDVRTNKLATKENNIKSGAGLVLLFFLFINSC